MKLRQTIREVDPDIDIEGDGRYDSPGMTG